MGTIPFALSIHHFISSVGADAGFAAIIGLAILILLYFAQARETSTLREHAYEASERIEALEARLSAAARAAAQNAAAQPAVAGTPAASRAAEAALVGVGGVAAARVGRGLPFAPAGVGAPALTAATRLIPLAQPAAVPAAAAASAAPLAAAPAVATAAGPAPATVAGGANGSSAGRPAPAAAPVAAATAAPPPRIQLTGGRAPSAAAPRRPLPPPRRNTYRSGRSRQILAGLLGLLVLAAIVVGLVLATSNNGGTTSTTSTSATSHHHRRASASVPSVVPSSVTVAVLNGTATNNLAHHVAANLTNDGYKTPIIATASNQTETTTTVGYLPGFRNDALAVANSLRLPSSAVKPVDQASQQVACPPPGSCSANVIVTVGANLSKTA